MYNQITISKRIVIETHAIGDACFVRELLDTLRIKYEEKCGIFTIEREKDFG